MRGRYCRIISPLALFQFSTVHIQILSNPEEVLLKPIVGMLPCIFHFLRIFSSGSKTATASLHRLFVRRFWEGRGERQTTEKILTWVWNVHEMFHSLCSISHQLSSMPLKLLGIAAILFLTEESIKSHVPLSRWRLEMLCKQHWPKENSWWHGFTRTGKTAEGAKEVAYSSEGCRYDKMLWPFCILAMVVAPIL